jgi:hypothetical protein
MVMMIFPFLFWGLFQQMKWPDSEVTAFREPWVRCLKTDASWANAVSLLPKLLISSGSFNRDPQSSIVN